MPLCPCCFDTDNLLRFTKLVKYIHVPELYFFAVFLKNRIFFLKSKNQQLQTMQLKSK